MDTVDIRIEVWCPVVGFEGRYEVSDQGRVRALRFVNRFTDRPRREPLVMRTFLNGRGYVGVTLSHHARIVHRLILEAFVGPCPDGCEGSHLNDNPTDNRLVNLRWEPKEVNLGRRRMATGERHSSRTHPERLPRGEAHRRSKLTAAQVLEIRAAGAVGESGQRVADRYGISRSTVSHIVRREQWTHLMGEAE